MGPGPSRFLGRSWGLQSRILAPETSFFGILVFGPHFQFILGALGLRSTIFGWISHDFRINFDVFLVLFSVLSACLFLASILDPIPIVFQCFLHAFASADMCFFANSPRIIAVCGRAAFWHLTDFPCVLGIVFAWFSHVFCMAFSTSILTQFFTWSFMEMYSILAPFWVPFGSLLHPSASFWLPFRLPFDSILESFSPLGGLWLPLAPFHLPFGSILARFGSHFAIFWHPFGFHLAPFWCVFPFLWRALCNLLCIWYATGLYVVCTMYMVCVWHVTGLCMVCMVCISRPYGISMSCIWYVNIMIMICILKPLPRIWYVYVVYMVCICHVYGVYVIVLSHVFLCVAKPLIS